MCMVRRLAAREDSSLDPSAIADRLAQKLIEACAAADAREVARAIGAGADVNARSANDGRTALFEASRADSAECVELVLKAGADAKSAGDASGRGPLWGASGVACARLLIGAGADFERVDRNGWTVLMWAADEGNESLVAELLARGARLEQTDSLGNTALLRAAISGHADCLERLLIARANPRCSSTGVVDVECEGKTAAMWAAGRGREDCLRILLDAGIGADEQAPNGSTAAMWAARSGEEGTLAILRDAGCDWTLRDDSGADAAGWAKRKKWLEGAALIEGWQIEAALGAPKELLIPENGDCGSLRL